jgi:MOSC domain-containing protein YiiM
LNPPKTGRVVSVNVGRPREIEWQGQAIRTGFFKDPVPGRVRVGWTNLAGDEQADLTVHGGVDKAVYAYPAEHYGFWRGELPGEDLPWGSFGENLTLEGFTEDTVSVGDHFRIGTAEFIVSQPRMPCAKLGARFRRLDMVKRFLESGRSGFYFRVHRESEVGAGDAVEHLPGDGEFSISRLVALYVAKNPDPALLTRVIRHPDLSEKWRSHLGKRLESREH